MQNSSLKVKGRQTVNVNGCKLVNLFFFFSLKKTTSWLLRLSIHITRETLRLRTGKFNHTQDFGQVGKGIIKLHTRNEPWHYDHSDRSALTFCTFGIRRSSSSSTETFERLRPMDTPNSIGQFSPFFMSCNSWVLETSELEVLIAMRSNRDFSLLSLFILVTPVAACARRPSCWLTA